MLRHLLFLSCLAYILAEATGCKRQTHEAAEPPSKEAFLIEQLTGAHTRVVWCENQELGKLDVFADGNTLVLKGMDTRDGKGERVIAANLGSYARPLLSTDGRAILYTDKNPAVNGDIHRFFPVVYRTNWAGSPPVKLADGYAVQCWHDPITGIEWVYAIQDIYESRQNLPMGGRRLVRFRLNEPSIMQTVYDDTALSPDNIQLSRDGRSSSALFPWPNAGVLRANGKALEAIKLTSGCCPSMAPDNSGVSWVFNGSHRSATFFADEGKKSWTVNFTGAPGVGANEIYHPRWSNHVRFFAATGPYHFVQRTNTSVINGEEKHITMIDSDLKLRPQVCIGKFNATIESVENWVQITSGPKDKYYPDVWIAGGERSQLATFKQAAPSTVKAIASASTWPANPEGLVFLFRDHSALNTFRAPDGKPVESRLSGIGLARFGRLHEMVFDGGHFRLEGDCATVSNAALHEFESSFEAMLLPSPTKAPNHGIEPLLNCSQYSVGQLESGALALACHTEFWQTAEPLPAKPFHLAVIKHAQAFDVYVDGVPMMLSLSTKAAEPSPAKETVLGGAHNFRMLNVAIYNRALKKSEIAQNARYSTLCEASFSPTPPKVRIKARLEEISPTPTAETIAPYSSCLVNYVYTPLSVIDGPVMKDRILVKHWAVLGKASISGFPRIVGKDYELLLESESSHPELKGVRVIDTTTAFDLEAWFDASTPKLDVPER